MKARGDSKTGDLLAYAHGNHAPRERLAMEMKIKPALQAAATRAKRYPKTPGHKGRDTGKAAADAAAPTAAGLRNAIRHCMLEQGEMTPDECAKRLAQSVLSIRPRFSELATQGSITDTGKRRRNASGRKAIVWRLKQQ